jgi:hypothetical protein
LAISQSRNAVKPPVGAGANAASFSARREPLATHPPLDSPINEGYNNRVQKPLDYESPMPKMSQRYHVLAAKVNDVRGTGGKKVNEKFNFGS